MLQNLDHVASSLQTKQVKKSKGSDTMTAAKNATAGADDIFAVFDAQAIVTNHDVSPIVSKSTDASKDKKLKKKEKKKKEKKKKDKKKKDKKKKDKKKQLSSVSSELSSSVIKPTPTPAPKSSTNLEDFYADDSDSD